MTDGLREMRCKRTVNDGKDLCPWRGTLDEFQEHAAETGHHACTVCRRPLTDHEQQTCSHCVQQAFADLADIEVTYATLPNTVEASGYRMGALPGGNALVMLADGSLENPQVPNRYTEPIEVGPTVYLEHPEIVGSGITTSGDAVEHPAYVELRVPSDGREHVRDHWSGDPSSVLAVLEHHQRDWRRTFGHKPAETLATVVGCVGYLRTWLPTAARTHPAFDEFVHDIRQLRSQLTHVNGLAMDPVPAKANCTRCGGQLLRAYREPGRTSDERLGGGLRAVDDLIQPIRDQRHAERTYGIPEHALTPWPAPWQQRAAAEPVMRGTKTEGLDDVAVCAGCGHTYTSGEYRVALRIKALAAATDWITIAAAASLLERPQQTVWTWMRRLEISSACRVDDRRVVVDANAVKARAARRKSSEQEAS